MSEPTLSAAAVRRIEQRYEQLKNQLLELGWISQGSLMRQLPNAWRWTYKVKTKTVTVALSKEQQAELYQKAITNHRKLEKLLRQMRELSQQVLLGSAPGVRKRARRKHPKSSLS